MTLIENLRNTPELATWIDELVAIGDGPFPVRIPAGSELLDIFADLGVPHEDINPGLVARPEEGSDAWWILERCVELLRRGLGELDNSPEFPRLTDGSDPALRYFYLYVYAAMYPLMMEWYTGKGIDLEIGRRSLADLGRQMQHHRRRYGYGGFNLNQDWLAEHFTGRLFQLGRLQFDRSGVGRTTASELQGAGIEINHRDPVLGVHIADYMGPFTPALCDESFARAREFFPRHFPDEKLDIVLCYSWLLAKDLPTYLPETSNILAFQRRFEITWRDRGSQNDMFINFVFQDDIANIDRLPQDTTLQRAIVDHIRNGHHWSEGVGWCRL